MHSTFCFLLAEKDSRDGNVWINKLLELKKQGLDPKKIIADFGNGLAKEFQTYMKIPRVMVMYFMYCII